MILSYESDSDFLKNANIDVKYKYIVHTIRIVLSRWTGQNPMTINSTIRTKEFRCPSWHSDEFVLDLLDELNIDIISTNGDFPVLFPCRLPFFREKSYDTIGGWAKAIIYEFLNVNVSKGFSGVDQTPENQESEKGKEKETDDRSCL